MKRFYYISDDLDDLEAVERELEDSGISTPQIHVLSDNDAGVEEHHLNQVASFLKKDVVHSTEIGFVLGMGAACIVVAVSHFSGIAHEVGWAPFILLAIVALGFVTWEAGLIGIQTPNVHFRRFEEALNEGKHILFVETDRDDEEALRKVLSRHVKLEPAGIDTSHSKWVITAQRSWQRFRNWA